MQQLEDLSKIVRDKDQQVEEKDVEIEALKGQNRDLNGEIKVIKSEAAAAAGERGNALLLNSSMAGQMMEDPRYRKIVEA